jgi:hypothetical protein
MKNKQRIYLVDDELIISMLAGIEEQDTKYIPNTGRRVVNRSNPEPAVVLLDIRIADKGIDVLKDTLLKI